MCTGKAAPGTGGERYIPYSERTGGESVVFFTRALSAEGLVKIFDRVKDALTGKVGVKLHTGERNGPNIIPRLWVETLFASRLSGTATHWQSAWRPATACAG